MKRIVVLAVLMVAGFAARADAKQVKFTGPHPIHSKGGGYCYIEAPHVHIYGPTGKAEAAYRDSEGGHFFVGDPVPHGYDGPRHAYNGHHPITVHEDTEFCYLNGPHYHYFTPEASVDFEVRGGVYYYVGHFPPAYAEAKVEYAPVNAYYAEYTYARPVVVVEPPAAAVYGVVGVPVVGVGVHAHGPVVHGGVAAGVGVHAGVEVSVPMPSVEVTVPGVIVEEHHHPVYFHGKHKHGKFKRWRH